MVDIASLKLGDKVHYIGFEGDEPQNGVVKSIPEDEFNFVFVVYHCAGEWDNYANYTAQRTNVKELYPGWKH